MGSGDTGSLAIQPGEEWYFSSSVCPVAAGCPRETAGRPSLKMGPFEGNPDSYGEARNSVPVTPKSVQLKAIHVLTHIAIEKDMEVNVTGVSCCTSLGHRIQDPRALFICLFLMVYNMFYVYNVIFQLLHTLERAHHQKFSFHLSSYN